jgi:hypothetical protein
MAFKLPPPPAWAWNVKTELGFRLFGLFTTFPTLFVMMVLF